LMVSYKPEAGQMKIPVVASYQILWITDVLSRKEATNESRCVNE
jgi:hypothetical protein